HRCLSLMLKRTKDSMREPFNSAELVNSDKFMHRPQRQLPAEWGGRATFARVGPDRRPPRGRVGGWFVLCVFALPHRQLSRNVIPTRSPDADDAARRSRPRGDRRPVMYSATVISLSAPPTLGRSYAPPSVGNRILPAGGATVLAFKRPGPSAAAGRMRQKSSV